MTPADFELLSSILKKRSGLVLTEDKTYLIESRLIPVARKRGLAGIDDLVAAVRKNSDEALLTDITEAMTTNESFFFRDTKPFELFEGEVLPQLLESRASRKAIRIWCAACSSGQEPYSLAMILKENAARLAGWKIDIVGTDISREVLDKAKAGLYSQFEVQRGLPIQLLVKYFSQANEMWQIDVGLRSMVQYRFANLLEDLKGLGTFDVVFCRNVLIYFDSPTKTTVLERLSSMMPPDGFLFLGGAETVLGVTTKFKPVQGMRGVYAVSRSTH